VMRANCDEKVWIVDTGLVCSTPFAFDSYHRTLLSIAV
jgi:hypothetical protein